MAKKAITKEELSDRYSDKKIACLADNVISQCHDLDMLPEGNTNIIEDTMHERVATAERLATMCRGEYARYRETYGGIMIEPGDAKDLLGIRVEITEDNCLSVRVPFLLPKRRWSEGRYIYDSVSPVLYDFLTENPWEAPKPAVIVFQYQYPEPRLMRDYDNMETKTIIDIISKITMKDDSPDNCKTFYCAKHADEWFTQIYVMAEHQFLGWLNRREMTEKTGARRWPCLSRLGSVRRNRRSKRQ